MKVLIESKELKVILCSRVDFMQRVEYVVLYGFEETKTDDFEVALGEFEQCCKHSANNEGWNL